MIWWKLSTSWKWDYHSDIVWAFVVGFLMGVSMAVICWYVLGMPRRWRP